MTEQRATCSPDPVTIFTPVALPLSRTCFFLHILWHWLPSLPSAVQFGPAIRGTSQNQTENKPLPHLSTLHVLPICLENNMHIFGVIPFIKPQNNP